jgi:undecaprenyl-diphosphatase
VDYRLYDEVNDFVARHTWLGHTAAGFEVVAVPILAVATVALWLLARPGAGAKWKLACVSALGSSALALLVNQGIAHIWSRPRPFVEHAPQRVFGARSHDPSFPSDHAAAAFAIAFAVFAYDRVVGGIFLAAAVAIGVGRVVVGAHYPADVLAGALVGLACALLVTKVGGPLARALVRLVERVTDPLVRPLWRLFAR